MSVSGPTIEPMLFSKKLVMAHDRVIPSLICDSLEDRMRATFLPLGACPCFGQMGQCPAVSRPASFVPDE